MTDITYAFALAPENDKPKKNYREVKLAYMKNKMENDAEFKQKVYDVSNKCHLEKRKNDPEYRAKYNEYQRNYFRQQREKAKLLKLQTLQQVATC